MAMTGLATTMDGRRSVLDVKTEGINTVSGPFEHVPCLEAIHPEPKLLTRAARSELDTGPVSIHTQVSPVATRKARRSSQDR